MRNEGVRFVVLDTETTGLDPRRDRIITIGAVAVVDGEILLDDSFEVLLRMAYNNSSLTVHGITRDEAAAGMEDATSRMAELVDDTHVMVSESGIRTPDDLKRLRAHGIHIVLVGEHLLRQPDPGTALAELLGREPREPATKR